MYRVNELGLDPERASQRELLQDFGPDYHQNSGEPDERRLRLWPRVRKLLDAAAPADGSACRILDAGCGTGRLAPLICGDMPGVDYLGCEISEEAVALARERHPEQTFVVADLAELDLDRKFHGVLCWGVLNFVAHPDRALERMAVHLEPGGRLVLLVSALFSLRHMARHILLGKPPRAGFRLEWLGGLTEWREALGGAGLSVVAVDGYQFNPGPMGLWEALLPLRLRDGLILTAERAVEAEGQ